LPTVRRNWHIEMTAPALVTNGRLNVPLFHGTSMLFYESIAANGLGARNIVEELRLRRVATALLPFCDERMNCDPESIVADRELMLRIAQEPNGTQNRDWGWNFRYGGTYLSASRKTAVNYAVLNKFGSEALSGIARTLQKLIPLYHELRSHSEVALLVSFLRKPCAPILVEAIDIPVELLRAEQGGSRHSALDRMNSALDDMSLYDRVVQQANFELVAPIPSRQLRFYAIRASVGVADELSDSDLSPL